MIVNELVNGVNSLQKINKMELNIRTTLKVIKNSEEFDRVLRIFHEKRNKIIEDFEPKTATTEETETVAKKIKTLLDEDVELEFEKLTLADLADIKISSEDLTSIMWLVESA